MGVSFKFDRTMFSAEVEKEVANKKCSYIDAILGLCEKYEIEPDTIAKLISKPIKEKLSVEGQKINLLPKKNSLPI